MKKLKSYKDYSPDLNFGKKLNLALYAALPESERLVLSELDVIGYNLNEGFGKKLTGKAENILKKIVAIGHSIMDFIGKIKEYLSKYIGSIMTTGKEKIKGVLSKDSKLTKELHLKICLKIHITPNYFQNQCSEKSKKIVKKICPRGI